MQPVVELVVERQLVGLVVVLLPVVVAAVEQLVAVAVERLVVVAVEQLVVAAVAVADDALVPFRPIYDLVLPVCVPISNRQPA